MQAHLPVWQNSRTVIRALLVVLGSLLTSHLGSSIDGTGRQVFPFKRPRRGGVHDRILTVVGRGALLTLYDEAHLQVLCHGPAVSGLRIPRSAALSKLYDCLFYLPSRSRRTGKGGSVLPGRRSFSR